MSLTDPAPTTAVQQLQRLQKLFRDDGIQYRLVPVAGYTDVQKEVLEAGDAVCSILSACACDAPAVICSRDNSLQLPVVSSSYVLPMQITSIVMINCGGTSNLKDLVDVPENCVIYVIDSHLPFHHTNINDDLNVSSCWFT